MRKWMLWMAAALLAAACHRGSEPAPADTVSPVPQPREVMDSTPVPEAETPDESSQQKGYTLQRDNAEVTNLRVFARKQRVIYTPDMLVGGWSRGTIHEEYAADGTGLTWNTAEDVSRDEARRFQWTLDSNLLTLVYKLDYGGVVPKHYVVTFVDNENLSYSDNYGESYLWDKSTAGGK